MPEYFHCQKGCTKCCPGEEDPIGVLATIGDVYRSFLFNNPQHQNFSGLFDDYFQFSAFPQRQAKEATLQETLSKGLPENTRLVILRCSYAITPAAKIPCPHLKQKGCHLHGTLAKYLVCVTQPEARLLPGKISDKKIAQENYSFFQCLRGKVLDDQASKIRALEAILNREKKITAALFPEIIVKDFSLDYCHNLTIDFEEKISRIIASFNNPANRTWEAKILETTKRYAEIMGFPFTPPNLSR